MALVNRPAQRPQWGNNHPTGADRAVLVDSDFNAGFVSGSPVFSRAYWNGLLNDLHVRGIYHLQGGAPVWGVDTDYRADALVSYGGSLWRATNAIGAGAAAPAVGAAWSQVGGVQTFASKTAGSMVATLPHNGWLHFVGVGGGGGGGGVHGDASGTAVCGGAGGGGARHGELWLPVVAGQLISIVVGAGGTGAAAGTGGARANSGGQTTMTLGGVTYFFPGASGGYSGHVWYIANMRWTGGAPLVQGSSTSVFRGDRASDSVVASTFAQGCPVPPNCGGCTGIGQTTAASLVYPFANLCGGSSGSYLGGTHGHVNGLSTLYDENGGGGGGGSSLPLQIGAAMGLSIPNNGGGGHGGESYRAGFPNLVGHNATAPGCGGGGAGGGPSGLTYTARAGGDGADGAYFLQYFTF